MSHIRNVPNPWDDFLSLTDTPSASDYTGEGGKFVRVNSTPDALEFTDDVVQKTGSTMTGALTLSADPTSDLHAATKQYVDALIQGLDVHESVRVASTANLTLTNEQTIDGVSVVAGDRVLVKNQTAGEDNGIYVCVDAGAWTRATDADSSAEVTTGMFCFVSEGTANADTGWVLATNDPITLGTTSLTFAQFSGAGTYVAGTGLTLTGNSFSADLNDTDGTIAAIGTQAAGTSDEIARADHVHAQDFETTDGNIANIGTQSAGSGTKVAHANHVHAHGDQAGGTLHADVIAGGADGFMTGTDKTKLDNLQGSGTSAGNTLYWSGSAWVESAIIFNDHSNAEVGINTATPNATLHVNGSVSAKVASTAASYDMASGTNGDIYTLLCTNTGSAGDITITLPAVANSTDRVYNVKKTGATDVDDEVVITPTDGTIDGAATLTLNYQYESVTLVCDGSNWFVV